MNAGPCNVRAGNLGAIRHYGSIVTTEPDPSPRRPAQVADLTKILGEQSIMVQSTSWLYRILWTLRLRSFGLLSAASNSRSSHGESEARSMLSPSREPTEYRLSSSEQSRATPGPEHSDQTSNYSPDAAGHRLRIEGADLADASTSVRTAQKSPSATLAE
jgi:hypothetical protein